MKKEVGENDDFIETDDAFDIRDSGLVNAIQLSQPDSESISGCQILMEMKTLRMALYRCLNQSSDYP